VRSIAQKQLLIGLPATGKTTFLAALWHVVESDEIPGSLRLKMLDGDRTYLNKIRNDWLSCRPLGRTTITAEQLVSMQLIEPATGRTAEIFFPDMSGESFSRQWTDRSWTKEYDALVRDAMGVLLFVHPAKITEPMRIDIANSLVEELDAVADSDSAAQDEEVAWDPALTPTQVQLVELLQFLLVRIADRTPFRIAIIVSAWDLVCQQGRSPEEWLTRHLSLLDQYLKGNPELFTTRVYGVSAQGGDLQQDVDRLREEHRPCERITIVGQDCLPHDLTAPVRWLMS
jgi:hypothetical protein